jgi:hypothetical protein
MSEFESRQGQEFSLSISSKPVLGPIQSLIKGVTGGGGSSLGVKLPEREADHSPPSRVWIQKKCLYIHPLIHTSLHFYLLHKVIYHKTELLHKTYRQIFSPSPNRHRKHFVRKFACLTHILESNMEVKIVLPCCKRLQNFLQVHHLDGVMKIFTV